MGKLRGSDLGARVDPARPAQQRVPLNTRSPCGRRSHRLAHACAADLRYHPRDTDLRRRLHEAHVTPLLHLGQHVCGDVIGRSILQGRIRESADAVDPCLVEPVEQSGDFGFGIAREANNERDLDHEIPENLAPEDNLRQRALELFSKTFEQDAQSCKLHEAEEVARAVFPAN